MLYDYLLVRVAQRLQVALRHRDILLRYGDEAFVLLTDAESGARARPHAERLMRSVCEEQAPRPSTVAAQPLGDDLDAIVMMALRKEPQRRYASAGQLGDDLGRVFSGQPVLARPDTVGYRLRKFVARNRLAVAAAAFVAVIAVIGVLALVPWSSDSELQQPVATTPSPATTTVPLFDSLSGDEMVGVVVP